MYAYKIFLCTYICRLRLEWAARGLNQSRLTTSALTDPRSNLLRMGAADIHLDTLLFNGHTTTTDSLWAGVPVLTKPVYVDVMYAYHVYI